MSVSMRVFWYTSLNKEVSKGASNLTSFFIPEQMSYFREGLDAQMSWGVIEQVHNSIYTEYTATSS